MFPEIEPYRTGFAEVGDGHQIYWEECGNPNGKPALVLHGGPGSGCSTNNRRYFDPSAYRVVLFDQRNCGRSKPHASEPRIDLSTNTTHHLVSDIDFLREMLGIERWLVKGASWGSVLALAYAEAFPSRVSELVLISVGSGRRAETDLLTYGLGRMFPSAWAELAEFASRAEGANVLEQMNKLLLDSDPAICEAAAKHWIAWEMAMLPTASGPGPRFASASYRLAFARIVTHYWANGSWLREGQVLEEAGRLAGIPGCILQGRLDLSNLSGTPWQLAARWPESELVFIEDSGHEGSPTFGDVLLARIRGYEP
jgi:proline iminopeptidase